MTLHASRAGYRPSAVRELPVRGGKGIRVCLALPPRWAGARRLDHWWPSLGSGLTLAEATRRATAEAVERACGVFQGHEPRITASFQELGGAAIHPASLLLVSQRQHTSARAKPRSPLTRIPPEFNERATIDWTPVWSLTHRVWKYVPSMYVYFRYPVRPAQRYCPADSNGVAAAPRRSAAALRALLELIERDSVALWWYNRARRPALDVASSPDPRVRRMLAFYQDTGRDVWVLDVTSDLGIPACVAVSRRRTARRDDLAFGFGAGVAHPSAARHALCEMAQVLAVRQAGGRGGFGTGPFERWRSRACAADWPHLLPSKAAPASPPVCPPMPTDARAALARSCEVLRRHGLEVLSCDLTRPGAPLTVVRIMVPGLRHMWPRLAPGRLYTAPEAAGWCRRPLPELRLNRVPLLL